VPPVHLYIPQIGVFSCEADSSPLPLMNPELMAEVFGLPIISPNSQPDPIFGLDASEQILTVKETFKTCGVLHWCQCCNISPIEVVFLPLFRISDFSPQYFPVALADGLRLHFC